MRVFIAAVVVGLLLASGNAPERQVIGNEIVSKSDPSVRIRLPKTVQYVGVDRWTLYGIADCELHGFVEADKQGNVQRLYWVQFEGYIPSRPELKYRYDSPEHAKIGGADFYLDTWVEAREAKRTPDSDQEHLEALIRSKNYKIPAGMMYVRLVHLLDEQRRKELMFIYGEDLAPTGFTAADLKKGGKAYDRWPGIKNALVERGIKKIEIEELGSH